MTLRISMWSGPRNISTALMYSFAQRADTAVVDEPLYGHYLAHTPARAYHPGADEVIAAMRTDAAAVVREVLLAPCPRPVLYIKNMTHHLAAIADRAFLVDLANVLLIRDPREVLLSYSKNVETPTAGDTGLPQALALRDELRALGREPVVIDSRELLSDPEAILTALCARLGIAFDPAMLSWPAGPRPEDGVWAKHWYDNVHRSTGFQPWRPREGNLPNALRPVLDTCQPLYEALSADAL